MDHLSKWIRLTRQATSKKRVEKRPRNATFLEEQLTQVESLMSSIDQDLMAQAAFTCKAYARALMTFEQRITTLQERKAPDEVLQGYYDRLHVIYAQLDEPDGMEGVSTKVISPSLEHQIREHESTGRWTSAQSCWEVKLQHSPENVSLHIGLLRCLRNLGHYGRYILVV
jgi:serine/threonine-protein kinase ATR